MRFHVRYRCGNRTSIVNFTRPQDEASPVWPQCVDNHGFRASTKRVVQSGSVSKRRPHNGCEELKLLTKDSPHSRPKKAVKYRTEKHADASHRLPTTSLMLRVDRELIQSLRTRSQTKNRENLLQMHTMLQKTPRQSCLRGGFVQTHEDQR